MKKCLLKWDARAVKAVTALMLWTGAWGLTSCKDDDGLTAGDPNYFTTSRGQRGQPDTLAVADDGYGERDHLCG